MLRDKNTGISTKNKISHNIMDAPDEHSSFDIDLSIVSFTFRLVHPSPSVLSGAQPCFSIFPVTTQGRYEMETWYQAEIYE